MRRQECYTNCLIHAMRLWVLRTPISAKYCWFGWCLGAWSTPSHHPTQLCDIYISGYKYTLISEWTRLVGLLRILDNLISGAVYCFCTTISVFCEIYTLRMRVVAHAAILWVGCVLCRRPELGSSICPHQWVNTRHQTPQGQHTRKTESPLQN